MHFLRLLTSRRTFECVAPRGRAVRRAGIGVGLSLFAAAPSLAQHAGHDMGAMRDTATQVSRGSLHVMLQAIPLVTHAAPSATRDDRTEAALTQTLAMLRGSFWQQRAALDVTLNGEGLTMPGGELNTGAYGEGYVDRRHPHAYLHEMVATLAHDAGPLALSASAGRGFAAFGTDDPMMRPFVKYPVNHHLSQILERGVLVGAMRAGRVIVEGSSFGGDEPTRPSSLPRASRLGDSWSTRVTLLPFTGVEVQGSYARVASPEEPQGFGLDQRKRSTSARWQTPGGDRYLLVEWERTVEHDHSRHLDAFGYESALAEGAMRTRGVALALRLEQTERPEEDRLADPFRTPRPSADLSIGGITRWRVATVNVSAPPVTAGPLSGLPFIEAARLVATPRDPSQAATPQRLYGTSRFWMLTAGVRLRVGGEHARMGRYGVARSNAAPVGATAAGAPHQH